MARGAFSAFSGSSTSKHPSQSELQASILSSKLRSRKPSSCASTSACSAFKACNKAKATKPVDESTGSAKRQCVRSELSAGSSKGVDTAKERSQNLTASDDNVHRTSHQCPALPGHDSHPLKQHAPSSDSKCAPSVTTAPTTVSNIVLPLPDIVSRFQGDDPAGVVGREQERAQLARFLQDTVGSRKAGGIYICGKPGCGKTAVVKDTVNQWRRKAKVIVVNSMALPKGLKDVYLQLYRALCPGSAIDGEDLTAKIDACLTTTAAASNTTRAGMVLLVMDELDALLDTGGSAVDADLRRLFEWTQRAGSRLVLVGIGNLLDLSQRPMAAFGANLKVMSFAPYTDAALLAILKARLLSSAEPATMAASAEPEGASTEAGEDLSTAGQHLRGVSVRFEDAALDLCARRISAESGDVRKALQACRHAAHAAAAAVHAAATAAAAISADSAPPPAAAVGVGVMAKKLSEALVGQGAQRFSGIASLPLHQQLVLCVLARQAAAGLPPLPPPALGQAYVRLCRRHGLPALAAGEAAGLAAGLVDAGLAARAPRGGVVSLSVPLPLVTAALQPVPLMTAILSCP